MTEPSSKAAAITWVVIVLVGCGATAAYQWWLSAASDSSPY
ncbi:hypothetical protein [Janibacter limosus]|jgi:hypothetical protein|nr:hypothetical protein [Janibacter limosus]